LVAGGVAGAVSRTATAPLDRLKVFLQVCYNVLNTTFSLFHDDQITYYLLTKAVRLKGKVRLYNLTFVIYFV